jgi:hypothetical protein
MRLGIREVGFSTLFAHCTGLVVALQAFVFM